MDEAFSPRSDASAASQVPLSPQFTRCILPGSVILLLANRILKDWRLTVSELRVQEKCDEFDGLPVVAWGAELLLEVERDQRADSGERLLRR